MISASALLEICPRCEAPHAVADALNLAMHMYSITDVPMFVAQLAHESGEFNKTLEMASGQAYEGSRVLGNTQPGDGKRFKGRGYIQLTGRDNYFRCGRAFNKDFTEHPELLEEPAWAAASAAWFWHDKKLNGLDLRTCTKRINGGYTHLDRRAAYYKKAQEVLLSKEPTMALPVIPAVLSALLPELVKHVPDVLRGLKKPEAAESVETAAKVFDVVKTAVGAANEQEAVEKVKNDPEAKAVAQQAVRDNWYQIFGGSEDSVATARAFNQNWDAGRLIFGQLRFVELLSLLLLGISAYGGYLVLEGPFSNELKGAVITAGLLSGYVGVREFWLGTSAKQEQKNER